jgi:hypothetical protein
MDRIKNFSLKKKSKNSQPYIIVSEFENITEKECIKFDKSNQENYNNLLSKAKQAQYTIRNSGLSMNLEVPLPPRPSNRDRFILWNRRNVSKPVIEQSNAIIFLNEHGYKLDTHYEAYQAIELAKEIRRKKGIIDTYKDSSKNFNNIYTQKDANIFRRRSMYGVENLSKNTQQTNNSEQQTNNGGQQPNNYGFQQTNNGGQQPNNYGFQQPNNYGFDDFSEPTNLEQMSEIDYQASMSPIINNSQLSLKRSSGSLNGRSGSLNGREYNNILDIEYTSQEPSAPLMSTNDCSFGKSNIDNVNFSKNNSLYPSLN